MTRSKLKVNLTKEILTSLRPQGHEERINVWDRKVEGLLCRISATGTVTFSVQKRTKGGRQERITLGKFPHITIEQARKMAIVIIASIGNGDNPAEVKRSHKAEPTFAQLFEKYCEEYAQIHKKSWEDDLCRFKSYLKGHFGNKKLSHIARDDVQEIHSKIAKTKKLVKKKGVVIKEKNLTVTSNRVLSLVSAVFSWGIRNGYCKDNPARGVQKYPERSRDRFLQPEELSKFFDAVNQETNTTIRDYILMSLYTGARRSNVVTMKWEDISMQFKIWRIPNTKNNDPVIVPLIDEAIQILESRKENKSEYVFPGDGEKGHLIDPKKGWARVLERSGLKDLRLHDLRRTLGSWQAIMGSSTLIIGKSLGHRSQKATEVYARLNIEPVRKSIEAATKAMIAAS